MSFNFVATLTVLKILDPKKIKSVTASTFSSPICHEVMGLNASSALMGVIVGWGRYGNARMMKLR